MDSEELEELEEKIDGMFGERYVPIPQISSREAFDHMEAFCETVQDENLRRKLRTSLGGKGSFSRFKDLISNHPEERERWFEFHNNKVAEQVRKWLEAGNIELVEPEPIEIIEISYDELSRSEEMDEDWKDFGARACMNCGSEADFERRYFIISREPGNADEIDWLAEQMKKQFGVDHYGIVAAIFGDRRGLIQFAACKKCNSQDVFFDF
jgi:hypothetical protein